MIAIRHPMSMNEKPGEFRLLIECHKRHPGACGEFWFATGSRKTIPDLEREVATFARYRPLCEEAGIKLGYQQGLTLGHGESHDGKPRPGDQTFPDDAWQRGRDGARIPFLCPRAPAVLEYERQYAATVMRAANPSSYWIDDDLRLGVSHPEGCFCDRCIAAFNAWAGAAWTREALAAALFAADGADAALRSAWIAFNAESLALYAAQVRRAADETGYAGFLGYQAVSANRLYPGRGYRPLLAALSGPGRRPVGIRPGHGFYNEAEPRGMVAKCLGVAREAERCRGTVASICYEEETYPRLMLHKSPGAIVTECALALASGCDSLSLYWFPGEAPLPVAEYDRFLAILATARPYFGRLAASARRSRLGGLARLAGPHPAPDFDLSDPADFDLACAGIPVTVAEGAPSAFYLTGKSRAEGFAAGAHNCGAEGFAAGAPAPAVIDISDIGRFPTAARRARLLDALDAATGGAFPVRVDECRPLRILPRVRPDGRLDSVTLLNLSIGATGPLAVRVRNPAGPVVLLDSPLLTAPQRAALAQGALPGEAVVSLPDLGPWQIATLFFEK